MKKTLIASVLGIVASVANTQGQGYVIFNNYNSQTFQHVAAVGGANAGSSVTVQLFWGNGVIADPNALTAGQIVSIDSVTFNSGGLYGGGGAGGYFSDGTQLLPSYSGGAATFMVQAWDTTTGATYALATTRGQSVLWQEARNNGSGGFGIAMGTEPAGFFGSGPAGPLLTPLVTLSVVPEPSTFALLGLGTAGLLFFRRRK